jgi:probable rRNA maturation factor
MAHLNREFRQKEGATNVLSFPQDEPGKSGLETDLLGDVVICTQVAEQDAQRMGYSNEEMILYLLIHGILHLVGHTHNLEQDAETMDLKTREIFRMLVSK